MADLVYTNIAYNPRTQNKAIALCRRYGKNPVNETDLADCLEDIVSENEEDGLRDVMNIHPEKEVILSFFNVPVSDETQRMVNMKNHYQFRHAEGAAAITPANNNNNNQNANAVTKTELIFFAGALILCAVILSK